MMRGSDLLWGSNQPLSLYIIEFSLCFFFKEQSTLTFGYLTLSQGDGGHLGFMVVSVRVLSEVCAGVF